MIGHDNEFQQGRIRKMKRDSPPTFFGDFTRIIQDHDIIFNISENTTAVMRYYRDEIQSHLRIIIFGQAD